MAEPEATQLLREKLAIRLATEHDRVSENPNSSAANAYQAGVGFCRDYWDALAIVALSTTHAVEAMRLKTLEAWQDIETAPNGAVDVLLRFPNGRLAVGWRHSAGYFLDCNAEMFKQAPTHWQPLPAPPAPKEADCG